MNMAHALSSTRPAWRLAALLALMLAALILLPSITLANSPPATPASVTLTRTGNTITVVWTPAGAAKYHATYSSDGGNSWTAISDNLTGTGASFGNTDTTKTYIVAVRAGNEHGWSGWRNSAASGPFGRGRGLGGHGFLLALRKILACEWAICRAEGIYESGIARARSHR